MTEQEILALAEKMRNGTATSEEKLRFFRELNSILSSVRGDLKGGDAKTNPN